MHPHASALIRLLDLTPHPEGGYYREVFRSPRMVRASDSAVERAAVTTIYFLLVAGQHSRWHRIRSDEVWHYYEGDPLECPRCKGPMRVIALIDDAALIRKILSHLGLWAPQ